MRSKFSFFEAKPKAGDMPLHITVHVSSHLAVSVPREL